MVKTVVFVGVGGSGRSPMAAAFFNELASPEAARALAVGVRPADQIQPEVLLAMREVGLELPSEKPRPFAPELAEDAGLIVAMGLDSAAMDPDSISAQNGTPRDDWSLADPSGQSIDRVRLIRDEIRMLVWKLIAREAWFHRFRQS